MRFALSLAIAMLPLALAAPGAELEKRTAGNVCEALQTPSPKLRITELTNTSLDLYVHGKRVVEYLVSIVLSHLGPMSQAVSR